MENWLCRYRWILTSDLEIWIENPKCSFDKGGRDYYNGSQLQGIIYNIGYGWYFRTVSCTDCRRLYHKCVNAWCSLCQGDVKRSPWILEHHSDRNLVDYPDLGSRKCGTKIIVLVVHQTIQLSKTGFKTEYLNSWCVGRVNTHAWRNWILLGKIFVLGYHQV